MISIRIISSLIFSLVIFIFIQISTKNEIRKNFRSLQGVDDVIRYVNPNADKRVTFNSKYMKDKYETDSRNFMDIPSINWSNLVVMMLTYDNPEANFLIQAQLDTWIKKAGEGLDIVFVTDVDDKRSDNEVVSYNKDLIKANIHVYRSNALKEGKRARSKVVDGFFHVERMFVNDANKKFYLKIDPDSYVLPEQLLFFIDRLNSQTHPYPVDFGNSICNNGVYCYTEGGLYGMNKVGFESAMRYIADHPDVLSEFVPPNVDPNRNTLDHEDSFTSYAFWKSTGFPVIWNRDISVGNFESEKPINPISVHPVKSYLEIYVLEKIFYDSEGRRRKLVSSHKLLLEFTDYFDFLLLEWDYEKGELVKKNSN